MRDGAAEPGTVGSARRRRRGIFLVLRRPAPSRPPNAHDHSRHARSSPRLPLRQPQHRPQADGARISRCSSATSTRRRPRCSRATSFPARRSCSAARRSRRHAARDRRQQQGAATSPPARAASRTRAAWPPPPPPSSAPTPDRVLVSSTGVIGVPLPIEKIERGLRGMAAELQDDPDGRRRRHHDHRHAPEGAVARRSATRRSPGSPRARA